MILIRYANRRQSPCILHVWIESDRVGFHRKRCVMRKHVHHAGKVTQVFLKLPTPLRHIGRKTAESEANRVQIKPPIQSSAAKQPVLGVDLVKVMDHAAHMHALEVVEGMLEYTRRHRSRIEHQVLAHQPARIRQAVRELLRFRHQQQARRLCTIRAQEYCLRPLPLLALLLVEVNYSCGAAQRIGLDLAHVAVRADFTAPRPLRYRDHRRQCGRLRAPLAAECLAEATVHATMSAAVVLRKDRQWRWKRVPAQFLRSTLNQHARRLDWQRRQWVRLRSRRIKRARSRQSRHAKFPLGSCVVPLEIRVSNWPVFQTRSRNWTPPGTLHEIDLMKPPIIGGEMNTAAADQPSIPDSWLRLRTVVLRLAKRVRLLAPVVSERVQVVRPVFVVLEVARLKTRSLLKHDHAKSIRGQLFRQDSACRAGSRDYEIHHICRLVSRRSGHHSPDFLPESNSAS